LADVAVEIRHEGVAQGGEAVFLSRKWRFFSCSIKLYFPPGRCSLCALKLQKQHSAGSAGTTMVGIVELLYRLSWRSDDRSHPWHLLFPNTPLMKSRGRRAIPIALRPLVFMKLYDALHHRTSPAGRGLGAVDNATSIQSGGY